VATNRAPLELVPDTAVIGMAMAFLEGALKYGRFNWRVAGVQASVYVGAFRRHVDAWWNGEDLDPKSGLHHIDKAMACLAIIRDAIVCGKLIDNRPPRAPLGAMLDLLEDRAAALRAQHADKSPYQFTIADSEP
jgi:hypothetical protein